jgi:cyclopropane fatty-acyl-phospholipid synthase-like methyltransferase
MSLPFSQSCENNKDFILAHLQRHFTKPLGRVLEIAGGTGQHAEHFAAQLPSIHWQSTDIPDNVTTLNLRLKATRLPNLPAATPFDVRQGILLLDPVDYIFSANSLHIMSADSVNHFFRHISYLLALDGVLCVYGPFKYHGEFTTSSNAKFDLWLKANNPESGIRDFEAVNALANAAGLILLEDNPMPANNQLLVWLKKGQGSPGAAADHTIADFT